MNPAMESNNLTLKTITELLGYNFYIPEYQRGYRWTKHNVQQLLDDIWEYRTKGTANSFYCLQPVVVKKTEWTNEQGDNLQGYELIDGQQRLTTLHRIITYLMLEHLRSDNLLEDYGKERYNVFYKTRPESKEFLLGDAENHTKPDLSYMSDAYQTIRNWFEDVAKGFTRGDKNKFLDVLLPPQNDAEWSVKLIWYEVKNNANTGDQQNSMEIFTRLNRGKIPLTSAELIKAMFVNSKSFADKSVEEKVRRRTELIQIWDEIEISLNDLKFWSFITNKQRDSYTSKIELLFDILTGKKEKHIDPLFSFIHFFSSNETGDSLWQKWIEVEELYKTLKHWYNNKNLYHKVGYLIVAGYSIQNLIEKMQKCRKAEFDRKLDYLIAETIPDNWHELNYQNTADVQKISHLLLLHNLEITRCNNNQNDFFPFEEYKKMNRSLEHIHAQNAEGIDPNKREQWTDWLKEHLNVLKGRPDKTDGITQLINETEEKLPNLTYQSFKPLSQKILVYFNADGNNNNGFMHRIENLALLSLENNIALSHSAFDVKRRKLVDMDKNGDFIPVATRRIFLKYYADEDEPNHTLWTSKDRNNYQLDLQVYFQPYLSLKTI